MGEKVDKFARVALKWRPILFEGIPSIIFGFVLFLLGILGIIRNARVVKTTATVNKESIVCRGGGGNRVCTYDITFVDKDGVTHTHKRSSKEYPPATQTIFYDPSNPTKLKPGISYTWYIIFIIFGLLSVAYGVFIIMLARSGEDARLLANFLT